MRWPPSILPRSTSDRRIPSSSTGPVSRSLVWARCCDPTFYAPSSAPTTREPSSEREGSGRASPRASSSAGTAERSAWQRECCRCDGAPPRELHHESLAIRDQRWLERLQRRDLRESRATLVA